jgi:hypothetical protein
MGRAGICLPCCAEHLLLHEVRPRLRNAIAQTVPRIGSDDEEELLQDGIVIAIHLLNSAQRSGKKVTAGNIAFYTLLSLRLGRRSTGCRKTDPLHPAARLSGRCQVVSLDDPVSSDESHDEPLTLGEILPSRDDDPATQACRRLDWDNLIQRLDAITKAILVCLATCDKMSGLVKRFSKSRSTIQNHKDRLARLIKEHMGEDILLQVQEQPGWRNDVQAIRERMASRWERSTV